MNTKQLLEALSEIVYGQTLCPIHNIKDCSPLLNGCSIPINFVERDPLVSVLEDYIFANRELKKK